MIGNKLVTVVGRAAGVAYEMGIDAVAAATPPDTHARDAVMVNVPEYTPAFRPRSGTENEIDPDQPLLPAGHVIAPDE
ncbi:MAG: hypothetical protein L7H04_07860 [Vulcanisaeta sp.]|nr:hypothetical protein [Vulcanisaeta sp.]